MNSYPYTSIILILTLSFSACQSGKKIEEPSVHGVYMNMTPTAVPVLLGPELIASSLREINGTFSPDGKEFFFTTETASDGAICQSRLDENNQWTTPIVAPFSGEYSEYDPLFAPDGERLYFSSERPLNPQDSSGNTNLWYVERLDSSWSSPIYVQLENTGTYYSSITHSGDIYFNIWDTGDMYKAINTSDGYKVEALPEVLNSENGEGDPFVSPDEDYIIYRGYNNSLGRGDLYISYKMGDEWTAPENLGEPINSSAHEMCPYVTVDGKYFIFSSSRMASDYEFTASENLHIPRNQHHTLDNGELNIYYMSADFIAEKRKKHE